MKRIFAGLMAAMFSVGLILSTAPPASANGVEPRSHGCNDVGTTNIRVCLYNFVGFLNFQGFWQRDFATVNQNCVNLSNHSWHNGGSVNDATSSLIITTGTVPTNTQFRVRFYNWTNCSSANGYFDYKLQYDNTYITREDLNVWDNQIGSVQIFLERP